MHHLSLWVPQARSPASFDVWAKTLADMSLSSRIYKGGVVLVPTLLVVVWIGRDSHRKYSAQCLTLREGSPRTGYYFIILQDKNCCPHFPGRNGGSERFHVCLKVKQHQRLTPGVVNTKPRSMVNG